MTINLTGGTRQKLDITLPFTTDLQAQTPVENGDNIEVKVVNPTYAPPGFNVLGDITISDPNIVGTGNAFADVAIGDVISNANITTGSGVVIAKADDNNITLDQNGASTMAGETLAVAPGTIAATYYIVELAHVFSGSTLTVTPTIHCFDGSKTVEGASLDDADNLTIADASSSQVYTAKQINLDTFYTNARTPRVNS